jgi:hypothetical protein
LGHDHSISTHMTELGQVNVLAARTYCAKLGMVIPTVAFSSADPRMYP